MCSHTFFVSTTSLLSSDLELNLTRAVDQRRQRRHERHALPSGSGILCHACGKRCTPDFGIRSYVNEDTCGAISQEPSPESLQ